MPQKLHGEIYKLSILAVGAYLGMEMHYNKYAEDLKPRFLYVSMNNLSFLVIPLPEDVKREILLGNFDGARKIINRLFKRDLPKDMVLRLKYEEERLRRLEKDYPHSREDALKILRESIVNFREEELDEWIKKGYIERIFINNEERFFERFLQNLFFLNKGIRGRRRRKDEIGEYINRLRGRTIRRINSGDLRRYRIVAGIKLRIKRKGQFRVWLPVPKENFQISKVKILSGYPQRYEIGDNKAPQRTIYFEAGAREYRVEFEYIIEEIRGGIDGDANISDNLKEKLPHVRFTPYIRALAEKIIDDAEGDYERARRIYEWITHNINYTYVREYAAYDNISEFMATNMRGDCGFFALLFITLCRAIGIPAKWQSGWFITPKFVSPHDWAQVFVDGSWLPVDASFGNYRRGGRVRNEFYFGNLDAFRMIANDDFQVDFIPEKKYWRSDPVDNQRGEVENERRNLYFDEFDSRLYVKEFTRV